MSTQYSVGQFVVCTIHKGWGIGRIETVEGMFITIRYADKSVLAVNTRLQPNRIKVVYDV